MGLLFYGLALLLFIFVNPVALFADSPKLPILLAGTYSASPSDAMKTFLPRFTIREVEQTNDYHFIVQLPHTNHMMHLASEWDDQGQPFYRGQTEVKKPVGSITVKVEISSTARGLIVRENIPLGYSSEGHPIGYYWRVHELPYRAYGSLDSFRRQALREHQPERKKAWELFYGARTGNLPQVLFLLSEAPLPKASFFSYSTILELALQGMRDTEVSELVRFFDERPSLAISEADWESMANALITHINEHFIPVELTRSGIPKVASALETILNKLSVERIPRLMTVATQLGDLAITHRALAQHPTEAEFAKAYSAGLRWVLSYEPAYTFGGTPKVLQKIEPNVSRNSRLEILTEAMDWKISPSKLVAWGDHLELNQEEWDSLVSKAALPPRAIFFNQFVVHASREQREKAILHLVNNLTQAKHLYRHVETRELTEKLSYSASKEARGAAHLVAYENDWFDITSIIARSPMIFPSQRNKENHSALSLAITKRNFSDANALLNAGASVSGRFGEHQDPILILALRNYSENSSIRLISELISAGADPKELSADGQSVLDCLSAVIKEQTSNFTRLENWSTAPDKLRLYNWLETTQGAQLKKRESPYQGALLHLKPRGKARKF